MVTVSRPLAVLIQMSSDRRVRYSNGHCRSGKSLRIISLTSLKQAGPSSAGTEYSISVCFTSRIDEMMSWLQPIRSYSRSSSGSTSASVSSRVLQAHQSPWGIQKNSKWRVAAINSSMRAKTSPGSSFHCFSCSR